eukprot:CAMPEP_0175701600 /NCGR_PEP_ID=MMETSP0097-20121207/35570_1 /TAXON_ID=311494 /ORGANISM="Alexandrium monilatum, Strain CCMP3105" /LENGTH=197 /DNA_ID=CAMNT_0017008833 /DNA_START=238 /DNA_END=828 /DNA_ORIENTATION=-
MHLAETLAEAVAEAQRRGAAGEEVRRRQAWHRRGCRTLQRPWPARGPSAPRHRCRRHPARCGRRTTGEEPEEVKLWCLRIGGVVRAPGALETGGRGGLPLRERGGVPRRRLLPAALAAGPRGRAACASCANCCGEGAVLPRPAARGFSAVVGCIGNGHRCRRRHWVTGAALDRERAALAGPDVVVHQLGGAPTRCRG